MVIRISVSNVLNIPSGVPNGFNQRPVLFLLYSFIFVEHLNNSAVNCYVDDGQMLHHFSPYEAQVTTKRLTNDLLKIAHNTSGQNLHFKS